MEPLFHRLQLRLGQLGWIGIVEDEMAGRRPEEASRGEHLSGGLVGDFDHAMGRHLECLRPPLGRPDDTGKPGPERIAIWLAAPDNQLKLFGWSDVRWKGGGTDDPTQRSIDKLGLNRRPQGRFIQSESVGEVGQVELEIELLQLALREDSLPLKIDKVHRSQECQWAQGSFGDSRVEQQVFLLQQRLGLQSGFNPVPWFEHQSAVDNRGSRQQFAYFQPLVGIFLALGVGGLFPEIPTIAPSASRDA